MLIMSVGILLLGYTLYCNVILSFVCLSLTQWDKQGSFQAVSFPKCHLHIYSFCFCSSITVYDNKWMHRFISFDGNISCHFKLSEFESSLKRLYGRVSILKGGVNVLLEFLECYIELIAWCTFMNIRFHWM